MRGFHRTQVLSYASLSAEGSVKLVKFCLFMTIYDDHLAEMKLSTIYRRCEVLTGPCPFRRVARVKIPAVGTERAPTVAQLSVNNHSFS